jgi:cation-transporting ATPase E
MTGDGVNDVLALKDSDCGIAMASGSEAACHVAKLVLLNSDFSALPSVVAEGRRVINNIERSASLFLVKNIFSFALSIITLFFANMPYPMMPLHLSMISAFTIGIPSFVLALEPNKELVKGRFLQNVLTRAAPGGFTNIIMVLLLEMFYLTFGRDIISLDSLRTMSALIVSVIGLMVLYHTCKPLNWKRWTLIGVMSLSVLFCFTVMSGLFEFAALDAKTSLIIFVLLLLSIYNIKFINRGFAYLFELIKKLIAFVKEKDQEEL